EVGIQRAVHRFEIDVPAEVGRELDADAAVHRRELHIGVGIDAADTGADAAVDVAGVDRSAARCDIDLAVDRAGIDLRRCAVDGHGAVDRVHADFDALRHEHAEIDPYIVVAHAAVAMRVVAVLVASRAVPPEGADHDAGIVRAELGGGEADVGRIAAPPVLGRHDLDVVTRRGRHGDRPVEVANANPGAGGNLSGPVEGVAALRPGVLSPRGGKGETGGQDGGAEGAEGGGHETRRMRVVKCVARQSRWALPFGERRRRSPLTVRTSRRRPPLPMRALMPRRLIRPLPSVSGKSLSMSPLTVDIDRSASRLAGRLSVTSPLTVLNSRSPWSESSSADTATSPLTEWARMPAAWRWVRCTSPLTLDASTSPCAPSMSMSPLTEPALTTTFAGSATSRSMRPLSQSR